MMTRYFLFIFLITLPSWLLADVRFERIQQDIRHQYDGDWEHFVGGGVSSFDCNGDDFPELYLAGGSNPARLLQNMVEKAGDKVAFRPNTPEILKLTHVTGSYPLDIDSDGIIDLVVLRVGENLLFRGEGDCRFSLFTDDLGFDSEDQWTTAFSASWEQGNHLPTLAFGQYVDRHNPQGPFEACDDNALYRPHATHYSSPLKLTPGFCSLSMLFSDWGRQGRMDLRVSNDRHYYVRNGAEQLWAMESKPRLYDEKDGWITHSIWGMGIASRDLSGDGIPEVFLTSMGDQKLQQLAEDSKKPTFHNARYDRGTTAHRPFMGDDGRPSTGWHAEFADVNNDGRDDIFIAKGNVEQMPSSAMRDPNNLLIQDTSGNFSEHAHDAGVASFARSRGATLADLNLDGLPDLVVVNRRAAPEIYQNKSDTQGNWLLVALHQTAPNRQAIGAWIEIRDAGKTWSREVTVGGGHGGGSAGYHHFGLGKSDKVEVRVIWPYSKPSAWAELNTNQRVMLERSQQGLQVIRHY